MVQLKEARCNISLNSTNHMLTHSNVNFAYLGLVTFWEISRNAHDQVMINKTLDEVSLLCGDKWIIIRPNYTFDEDRPGLIRDQIMVLHRTCKRIG